MTKSDVAIVDYGVGNLFNLRRAFEYLGANAVLATDPKQLKDAPRVLLPGVGAFGEGMKNLKASGMDQAVKDYAASGKPLMGICLGMQLLVTSSEEHGFWEGLNLIPGKVTALKAQPGERLKIPHIGWSSIAPSQAQKRRLNQFWKGTVLEDLKEHASVYFVHSMMVQVDDSADALAVSTYGANEFCSVIAHGSISGCQFHPELSGPVGIKILSSFLKQG